MSSYYYGLQSPCPPKCSTCPCVQGAAGQATNSACGGTFTPGSNRCGHSSVLLSSGMFAFQQDLLSISAINGINWVFSLDYLAGNGVNGIVGKNFNFPDNLQMQPAPASLPSTDVVLAGGDNTLNAFSQSSPGVYAAAGNNTTRANLTRSGMGGPSDQFRLVSAAGTASLFFGLDPSIATPGCLKSVTDRYGNAQTYQWQALGGVSQLLKVIDSYGRAIDFSYYGSECGYLLRQITDFLGRQLNFQFDQFGHLVAVITPSITQAAQGNTFPGGTAYVFQYDVNNPRPERRDDLVKIWYPNQATPFIDAATRTIDVQQVYQSATPRYIVGYGQDPTDEDYYGRVVQETVGDPANAVGGTFQYLYNSSPTVSNLIDPDDPILFQCIVTDRNDNQTIYDFNSAGMPSRVEVMRSRSKINIPSLGTFPSYVTWKKYNAQNQPLAIVYPLGNSVEYAYENGVISGFSGVYNPRVGLLLSRKQRYDNGYGFTVHLPASPGTSDTSPEESTDQTQLTELYFYDPIFNAQCAMIERRGNPINGSDDYFAPQNGGAPPTDSDRSRYATTTIYDYQKNQAASVEDDTNLQSQLGLTSAQIASLIAFVGSQMTSGGLPSGFQMNLGDINGDGTGDGDSSTLPYATPLGNPVKVQHPEVTLVQSGDPSDWSPNQPRWELFTTNAVGQTTTHTDPEGNLKVFVRYPFNDPEGNGGLTDPNLSTNGGKQYGRLKEIHVDANPDHVLSLLGWSSNTQCDADLVDFIPGKITRANTPGVYQDLVTRFEGGSGASGSGCASCAYDALGNPLAQTDPRGFTSRFDRNELGEAYRTISPAPYNFTVEMYFDANRNTMRVDTEDQQPAYDSADPSSACYAQFSPSGGGGTAHVPMRPGPGGAVRPGWFTNLFQFDLLDNKIEADLDATGSNPANLITKFLHDPNQNLIQITKPKGNIVEYDFDERNLRFATRIGMDATTGEPGSITITPFDANGNAMETIGPASRTTGGGTQGTAVIADAFRSGTSLTHTGDLTANGFDGFNRPITSTDPLGNVESKFYDPNGKVIFEQTTGANGYGYSGILLASKESRFDEASRKYEAQKNVFLAADTTLPSGRAITHTGGGLAANSTANDHTGTVTLTSGDSSYVLTRAIYDAAGRATGELADNTGLTTIAFDGAGRKIEITDAKNNVVQNTLDGNGNVIFSARTEVCTITSPTVPNEIFQSAGLYDSLNKLVLRARQGADGTLDLSLLSCGSTAIWQVPSDTIIDRMGYDSRGNDCLIIDPKGNTSLTIFDGASRNIGTQQHLRVAGQGSNPPVANQSNAALTPGSQLPAPTGSLLPGASACVVTTSILDGNGRLTQLIDDRGNITAFQFDTMDRQLITTFHDGSTRTNVYDEAGDVTKYTDENGSVFSNTFDALGRKVSVSIAPAAGVAGNSGSGVDGTIAQAFTFDGLSRVTDSTDTVSNYFSGGGGVAEVKMFYDSLSRILEDSQLYGGHTRNVTNAAFTSYPVTTFEFPNNRELTNTYDALYRRSQVQEASGGANIASWQFFGPSRVAEVTLGNGLICTWMNNARTNSAVQPAVANPVWGDQSSDRLGYDGAGRPITKRYLAGGINGTSHAYNTPSSLVGFTTEYDLASNKFYERHLHAEERSHLYEAFSNGSPTGGYDSLNRLRQYQRGILTSNDGFAGNGGGSIATPIALPGTDLSRTYDLDSLGNWRRTVFTPEGGSSETEVRQHNGLNEITRIQNGATQTNLLYDGITGASNGNLANDSTRKYICDALNRLMAVYKNPNTSPVLIASYTYDALNRRVRKMVVDLSGGFGGLTGDIPAGTTDCIYSGWRCVEERNGSNDATIQYIWGIYLDELLQQYNYAAINGFSINAALYPLQDLLYRTTGLADSSGVVREAYDTDAYGNTLIFRNSGTPPGAITWTDSDTQVNYPTCTFIFTGQRFDPETQIYYYKRRYYGPVIGRFLSVDPLFGDSRKYADPAADLQYHNEPFSGEPGRWDNTNAQVWMGQDPMPPPYGTNPYEYCGSSPANFEDPSGLAELPPVERPGTRVTANGTTTAIFDVYDDGNTWVGNKLVTSGNVTVRVGGGVAAAGAAYGVAVSPSLAVPVAGEIAEAPGAGAILCGGLVAGIGSVEWLGGSAVNWVFGSGKQTIVRTFRGSVP